MKKKTRRMWEALEKNVDYLRQANARQGREIIELREQVRRNDITIRGALMPFVNDLAAGVTDGTVQFRVDVDHLDVGTGMTGRVLVPGLREWHCTYKSSRVTYKDGEMVETRFSRP